MSKEKVCNHASCVPPACGGTDLPNFKVNPTDVQIRAAYDAGYRAALEDAAQAADNEHLLDATGEGGDIAYDSAVDDCVEAIRRLGQTSKPAPEAEG